MKKFIIVAFVLCAVLLSVFPSFAGPTYYSRSSGLQTADAAITTAGGYMTGVAIVTDGTNDATVVVYDNGASAAGTVLFKGKVSGASNLGGATFEIPIQYDDGIYVDVTGTGAAYIVYYQIGY